MVVIPRTSEHEHKLFLYLRELARQGFSTNIPELYLFNLLHTHSTEAEHYGFERTREFAEYLHADEIARAIEESNRARRAIRSLLTLRDGPEPRLGGTEALAVIGAAYFTDRVEYAHLADAAAAEISNRVPIRGPRILIKGSPLHHTGLHRAIEAHGAVVVGEDDWWGSRFSMREIPAQGDMVRAIFEMYYRDAPSPRESSHAWFLAASSQTDGVVFYLPPEDDVLGWDYPRLRQLLDQRGTPNLRVGEDASRELSSECHQRIEDFVRRLDA
jgi:benzoyl-CoA reductase/2-hydroxyglutaryl-CoA dehydratase subunit BcrC/BadD/HgdB